MNIFAVTQENKNLYNDFIAGENSSFLQSYEWGGWQESMGRKVSRYLVVEKNSSTTDTTHLAVQLIEYKTPLGTYMYCPHGPVIREGLETTKLTEALEVLIQKVTEDFPRSVFIRLEPTFKLPPISPSIHHSEHVQPDQSLVLRITKPTNELLTGFHSKTRYNIKVAQKHGVQVTSYLKPEAAIVNLILATSKRQGYRNHSREYIENLWKYFSTHEGGVRVTGYLAAAENKPAAGAIMVDFAKTRMYLFGGSNYELRSSMAPFLLHWTAITDAQQLQLQWYDFGAPETASGTTGGFMRFKLGFNPEHVTFGGTWDIVHRPSWYTIYKWLRKLNRSIKHLHS